MVRRVVGYEGPITWGMDRLNGASQKLPDVGRSAPLGWKLRMSLEESLRYTYD